MKPENRRMLIIACLISFVLVILFVVWMWGGSGLLTMIKYIAIFSLLIAAIGVIVWVIIWLFQTKKIDLVAVHRDNIIESCKLNQTPYVQRLQMTAYGDNWAIRDLGRVIGCCMIHSQPKKKIVVKEREKVAEPVQSKYDHMVFITYQTNSLFAKLFGEYEVVGGTLDDFTTLTADIVYLKGMTFSPKMFGILFLSHHWEQRQLIDETITQNIYRYVLQENLKELATMMEDAIDASPAFKKKQEMQNVQQVMPQTQQQTGGAR